MTMQEHALEYARQGIRVFPLHSPENGKCSCRRDDCTSPAKHPRNQNGHLGATTDLEKVKRWWEDFPNANIGAATENFLVLDCDSDEAVYYANEQGLPSTFSVERGGHRHYFFSQTNPPVPRLTGSNAIFEHLDVLGTGGYVVMAPSVHISGDVYKANKAFCFSDLPEFPSWAENMARQKKGKGGDRVERSAECKDPASAIASGGRNAALAEAAWGMREQGFSFEEIRAALLSLNSRRCSPPLSEHEVETIAKSFSKYESPDRAAFFAEALNIATSGNAAGDNQDTKEEKDKKRALYEQARTMISDESLCQDVIAKKASVMRFLEDDQAWIAYDGLVWKQDESAATEAVHEALMEKSVVVKAMADVADSDAEYNKYQTMLSTLGAFRKLRDVKAYTGEFLRAKSTDFDSMIDYFPTASGLVCLKDGSITPNAPEHFFTFGSSYTYNKNAECPKFRAWLKSIMMDRESIADWLQVYFGYCLTGHISEHMFPVFFGDGRNGKGTLVRTIQAIMGPRASRTANVKILLSSEQNGSEAQYAFASLQGSRFVSVSEPKKTATLDTGLVKSITGGDVVSCRQIYGRAKEYIPTWKILMQANHKPSIPEQDAGIWRRVKLIPFDFTVKDGEEEHDLEKTFLEEEGEGILRWMVLGAMYWYDHKSLPYCEAIESETKEYREEEDTLKAFLDDCVTIYPPDDPAYESKVHNNDLIVEYVKWSNENRGGKLSRQTFSKELRRYGIERGRYRPDTKGNAVWYYLHCALKNTIYDKA